MLYLLLLSRIHWQAEMTSDVFACPFASITLTETIGAVGAAPARSEAAAAAAAECRLRSGRAARGLDDDRDLLARRRLRRREQALRDERAAGPARARWGRSRRQRHCERTQQDARRNETTAALAPQNRRP